MPAVCVRLTGVASGEALIAQMSSLPERRLWNAMRVPSGDHAASMSSAVLLVSRVGFEPSGPIQYSSAFRSRPLWNRILVPSGDHAGLAFWKGELLVSCTGDEPSAPMVQISNDPAWVRSLWKASLRPFGPQVGAWSFAAFRLTLTWFEPSAFMT